MSRKKIQELTLTEKQIKFCEEYLIDLNATRAAKAAGYSEISAGVIGHETLTKPYIQEYLSKRQLELQEATGVTSKRVIEEYAKIAFFDLRKAYTVDGSLKSVSEFDDDTAGAISGIDIYEERITDVASGENITIGTTKKIKLHDKIRALDSLGRHLGIFEEDNKQREIAPPTINILPPNGN